MVHRDVSSSLRGPVGHAKNRCFRPGHAKQFTHLLVTLACVSHYLTLSFLPGNTSNPSGSLPPLDGRPAGKER